MIRQYLFFGFFLFLATDSFAALRYRTGTEILSQDSEAIDLQFQSFSKKSSFDETGAELVSTNANSFTVNDWMLKYTKGFYSDVEASFFGNFRSVSPEPQSSISSHSGLESIGLEGKYLFLINKNFKNALGLRLRKATFSNSQYTPSTAPPTDKVVLGDDGLEYGLDYLVTYYDYHLKYDFKLGYNKPSSYLSSEMLYNAAVIYYLTKISFITGIEGIYSLKNDTYTESPSLKPIISGGNSRLFNSINRQKTSLFAGAQYSFGNFIVALRGETIFKARSSDTGNTISFNIRWENNQISTNTETRRQNYFAEGFVKKISTKGSLLKINIGSEKQLSKGDHVDIFNANDYAKSYPIATGTIFEVDSEEATVRINQKFDNSPVQISSLVKVY
ncbi:MAG: hypothetical protein H7281_05555 [Bacteriovorax sp.]|nr:hypothetical protein [Bacteriovorax sp.]